MGRVLDAGCAAAVTTRSGAASAPRTARPQNRAVGRPPLGARAAGDPPLGARAAGGRALQGPEEADAKRDPKLISPQLRSARLRPPSGSSR